LKLSPGALSEILSGKRPLTLKLIQKISAPLGLKASDWLSPAGTQAESEKLKERQLSLDLFRIVSDWYCFAILNLAETENFREDSNWIARRMGIAPMEAKLALERLERVGLLERVQGRLRPDPSFVMSPSDLPSDAIRQFHKQILSKAMAALDTHPIDERDVTGMTLAMDPVRFPQIKKDIREFQDRLASKYSTGKKTEVYHLEMAMFRLSEGVKS
jgi:uncharacterized protein (TIGR02147 family)